MMWPHIPLGRSTAMGQTMHLAALGEPSQQRSKLLRFPLPLYGLWPEACSAAFGQQMPPHTKQWQRGGTASGQHGGTAQRDTASGQTSGTASGQMNPKDWFWPDDPRADIVQDSGQLRNLLSHPQMPFVADDRPFPKRGYHDLLNSCPTAQK